jgi:glycosyltransferase involved in cell wall biosynthesis
MNILQVIPIFNPPELYGGSQQVVYQISKELVKRGHEVSIYTSDVKRSNLKERVEKVTEEIDGIKVFHFKTVAASLLTKKIRLLITPEMGRSLKQEARCFDLIHVHEARSYQHKIVWQHARKNKLQYIIQAHGNLGFQEGLLRKFYDFFYCSKILRGAAKDIALSRTEAEQYRRMGVPEEKIAIIPNGIDLSEYANLPPKGCFKKKFGIEEEKIVLYLGRIHKIKGIDILVKAFANVVKKLDDVRLVIVGPDDGYLRELKTLIKASKMENNVLITGPLYGRDKLEAYVDADAYVMPSKYEIWGMTVLEAYACGKPVIASSIMSISDIVVNERTGVLFRAGDIKELAEKIKYMLVHSEKSEQMGNEARKFVEEKFSIDKVVNLLEALYEKVL